MVIQAVIEQHVPASITWTALPDSRRRPVPPNFDPAMLLLFSLRVLQVCLLTRSVTCELEPVLDCLVQRPLICLKGEHVVCVLLHNLLGNGFLAPPRSNRHTAALHV